MAQFDYAEKRVLAAQSMREQVFLQGRRVHVVGSLCEVAGLWLLLSEYPDPKGRYIYDPTVTYLVEWTAVQQVLSSTREFLPEQVTRKQNADASSKEQHVFGIKSERYGFLRFERLIDEATFIRLTRYNGLPQGWCAWHSGWNGSWHYVLDCYPVITRGMWRRWLTGIEPEWDPSFLLPQDPVPLMEQFVEYRQVTKTLRVVPATLTDANRYVKLFHRHCEPVIGAQYALAVTDAAGLVRGVAILGRPIARMLDVGIDGGMKRRIIEVRRVATDGTKNVNSMLYGAARRLAREAGYEKIITYILETEPGTGLLADGWICVAESGQKQWDNRSRYRERKPIHDLRKFRWECTLNTPFAFAHIRFPADPEQKYILR